MNRRLTATLIGLFVLGGIVLLIAGIIYIGGGKYFSEQIKLVCYFDGSINGLQIGSPVKFRGAKVGEVSDIRVEVHHQSREISLPVIIQLEKDRVYESETIGRQDDYKLLQVLIKRGLRAQLNLQSIVTGQLYVELDFHPESPIKLRATNQYLEMPTIPSSTAEISKLAISARQAFDDMQAFLNSKDLNRAITRLSNAMYSGQELMVTGQKLLINVNQRVEPLAAKTGRFLDDFSDALRSIRVLTEYLSRHPEALIAGKYKGRE